MKTRTAIRPTARGFTLIELLAVMAIIALIAGLSLPALHTGSNLASGGNRIVGLVERARQHAMSNNVMTALVLITNANTGGDYRAFTLLEYNAEDATPQWRQVSPWESLPAGVVVETNTSDSTFLINTVNPLPFIDPLNPLTLRYQGVNVGSSYAARVFLPSGGVTNPSYPARIQLVEGLFKNSSVVYTRPGSTGGANWYGIAIVGATGRGIVERP